MFKFSSSFQPLAHVHRIERNALYPLDIYSSLLEYKNNDRRKDRDIYFYSSRGSIETLTDRIASGKRPRDVFPFTRARVDLDSLSLSFSLSFSPPLFLPFFLSFRSVTISSLRESKGRRKKKKKRKRNRISPAPEGCHYSRTNDNKCRTSTRLVFLSLSSSNSLITKRRPFRGW